MEHVYSTSWSKMATTSLICLQRSSWNPENYPTTHYLVLTGMESMSLISKDGNSCMYSISHWNMRKLRKSQTVYFFNTQKKLDFKLFVGQLLLLCHHSLYHLEQRQNVDFLSICKKIDRWSKVSTRVYVTFVLRNSLCVLYKSSLIKAQSGKAPCTWGLTASKMHGMSPR